jgi:hypothetical protein
LCVPMLRPSLALLDAARYLLHARSSGPASSSPLPSRRCRAGRSASWQACGIRNACQICCTPPPCRSAHVHCSNGSLGSSVTQDMNEAVLQAVEEHALTPEAIELVIHLTERDDVTDQQGALDRERKDVEKRIARLVAAIETGADAAALVAKLRELEARRRAIDVEAASLRPVPRLAPAVIENRLAEWRRLLRASTTQGRTVLQRILRGRLTFTPREDGQGYDFEGPTRFDKLFSGMVCEVPAWVKAYTGKTGFEDTGPEDTFDGDYGRLLEAASMRKGVCTRQDLNLRPPV